jgi:cytochrome c oxidase assembly protein subunit 15
MLFGAAIALLPLLWVLVRHRGGARGGRWQMLARLLLFLTFDLVLFGAFTRLTDSGLGCPDWPGCYGTARPRGAPPVSRAPAAAMPGGPVTHGKAWIEMVHRYAATSIGALITLMMIVAWWQRRRDPHSPLSPAWATAVFVWVCVQGAFGALTVTLKLYPAIVTLHLLGGYLGLVLITVLARERQQPALAISAGLRRALWAMLALLFLQSALGGWVSTNYAVLACNEFPRCQGSWWPPMDFAHGFTVMRDLGATAAGDLLPFAALTAIHYVHRLAAYLVLLCLLLLGWFLRRAAEPLLSRLGLALLALAAWQFASGLSNVVLGWPMLAALAHTGGAGAAIVCVSALLTRTQVGRAARGAAPLRPAAAAGPAAVRR